MKQNFGTCFSPGFLAGPGRAVRNAFFGLALALVFGSPSGAFGQCPIPSDNVHFQTNAEITAFLAAWPGCTAFSGNVEISGLSSDIVDLSALDGFTSIAGGLHLHDIPGLTSANHLLDGLTQIGTSINVTKTGVTSLDFSDLTNVSLTSFVVSNNAVLVDLKAPELVTSISPGSVGIGNSPLLTEFSGLQALQTIGYHLEIGGTGLDGSELDFSQLQTIGGGLYIYNHPNLTQLAHFDNLTHINGNDLDISQCPQLAFLGNSFDQLEHVQGSVSVMNTPLLGDFDWLPSLLHIGWLFQIHNTSAQTLDISNAGQPLSRGNVWVFNNPQLTTFHGPNGVENLVGGVVFQSNPNLETFTGFEDLESIGAYLQFGPSKVVAFPANTFSQLQSIGWSFILYNNSELTNLDNFAMLNEVLRGNTGHPWAIDIYNNPKLMDCCAIFPLIDGLGTYYGPVNINNNLTHCFNEPAIFAACPDGDGDGFSISDGDCDDMNAAIFPGATEICNAIDDDCDGQVDEGFAGPLTVQIQNGGQSICPGSSITMTATGGDFYLWSGGETTASITVSPAITTIYTVTATDASGCTGSATTVVTVTPTPTMTSPSNQMVCDGSMTAPVTFVGSTGTTTFSWNNSVTTIGLANIGSGDIGAFQAQNPTSGLLTGFVSVTPTDGGCVGTPVIFGITVRPLPNAGISDMTICPGATTSFTASGGVSYIWTTLSTIANSGPVSAPGVYTVTVTDGFGCTGSTSATLSFLPGPSLAVSGNTSFCSGKNTVLTASGATNYQWSNGSPTASSGNITFAGTYTVTGTDGSGCTSVVATVVTVNPLPQVFTVSGFANVCPGTTVNINLSGSEANPDVCYQLKKGSAMIGLPQPGTGGPLTFSMALSGGNYTVVATNKITGCTKLMTGFATVLLKPAPGKFTITGGGTYCTGGPGLPVGIANGQAGVSYQLLVGGSATGAPITGTGPISFGLQTAGTYTVTATMLSSGCSVTPTNFVTISVFPPPSTADAGPDQYICLTDNALLAAALPAVGIGEWTSISGPNTSILQINNQFSPTASFTPMGAGIYTLTWTVSNPPCPIKSTDDVQITVFAVPFVNPVANKVFCAGAWTPISSFSGGPAGVFFRWTNNNTAIGLAASGSGKLLPTFLAKNPGTTPITATITVTPYLAAQAAYTPSTSGTFCPVVNLQTRSVDAVVTGLGAVHDGVSVSPDCESVYISNYNPGTVSTVDAATNTVPGAATAAGPQPVGVATSTDGQRVYVANRLSNSVSVLDVVSQTVVAIVPVGASPFGICAGPDGQRVYVANRDDGTVSVLETATNTVIATIPVGSLPQGICANPNGTKIYVANGGSNTVSVIDPKTNTVVLTVSHVSIDNPYGIAARPDGARVYVANKGSGYVTVLNTGGVVVATVQVGTDPTGISTNLDGSKVYVACTSADELWEIKTSANIIVPPAIDLAASSDAIGNFVGVWEGSICPGQYIRFTITVNPAPIVAIASIVPDPHVYHPGKLVTVTASGGVPPYTFKRCTPPAPGTCSWNGPGGVFHDVPTGNWIFKATDANNCSGYLEYPVPFAPDEAEAREILVEKSPGEIQLLENRPNPFGDETEIRFYLPETMPATITIWDKTGVLLFKKEDVFPGGENAISLNGNELGASRVLICRLETASGAALRQMLRME